MKTLYLLLANLLFIGTIQSFSQGNFSSNVVTGDWNVAGSWTLTSGTDADGVPDADDNVSILDGHTITITDDASCASLAVGAGTSGALNIGNSAGDDLAVSGNITINAGASMLATSAGVLTLGGNITNNGTLDLNGVNDVNTIFNGTTNQTVSGTGPSTDFNFITINNSGAVDDNVVEIMSTVFTVPSGFLTLTDGIIKISGSYVLNNFFFNSPNYTIAAGTGVWLNNSNVQVLVQNGTATLAGLIRVTLGSYRVGNSVNNSLQYTGSTAQLISEGGNMVISGRFCRDGNNASTITYTQSGGNIQVGGSGSTSTTRAIFEIANAGSSFTMSGGSIILIRANASFSSDYFNEAGTYSVTSSLGLQIGGTTTPAGQIMRIYSTVPMGSLLVSSTNSPTAQLLTGLTITNTLQISPGATLNMNNQNLSLGRSWTNNGTFIAGTGTVTCNGSISRTFSGSSLTLFYNLVLNTTATTINFSTTQTVTNALTLIDGIVTTSASAPLTLTDNATVTGASDASFVSGPVRKIGDDAFTFPVGKSAGGLYQPISISAPANVTDDFTAEYIRSSATFLDADVVAPVRNVSSCDHWTLTKNSGAAAGIDVTLSWNANSPCGTTLFVTNPATLTVAHYNGAAWDEAGTSGSFTGTATAGTVTRNAVSVFSPFSLGNTAAGENPLPVRFGRLKGYMKGNGVQIDWDVYTEENVSRYEVQRSADGQQFSNIGLVSARNEPGRSAYGFFDAMPLTGTNFYRIRSVDVDGKFGYSAVARIAPGKKDGGITIYPNPVRSGNLSFQSAGMQKGNYTVKVFNTLAQQVFTQMIDHTGGPLSYFVQLPHGIKPGIYYLQVENGEKSFRKKFIVQQ